MRRLREDGFGGLEGERSIRVMGLVPAVGLASIVVLALMHASPGLGAGTTAESKHMRLVGYHDLQGRSAYQPVIQEQDGRWIAYVGHHEGRALNPLTGSAETNGTSIVEVTDPAHPVYLHHIPGASGAQMVQTCRGADLPVGNRQTYLLRAKGHVGRVPVGCG
jgi:hypothetical protein